VSRPELCDQFSFEGFLLLFGGKLFGGKLSGRHHWINL
jgi:hypothetical protein